MKKIISGIILSGLVLSLAAPMAVLAQDIPNRCSVSISSGRSPAECALGAVITEDPAGSGNCDPAVGNCGFCCLLNVIYKITDWVFYILMLVVVLMIIYGGFLYVTASGDPSKAEKGKQVLTFAIIGLAIALLAKIIPGVVKFIMGTSTA